MGQGLLCAATISVKKVAVCFLYDIYYTDTGNNDNTYDSDEKEAREVQEKAK